MIVTDTKDKINHSNHPKHLSILDLDMFSLKVIRFRPIFLVLFFLALLVIFYLAVLNPDFIFSIISGLVLFVAGFFLSNIFYLNASGKKEDIFNRMIIENSSDLFLIFQVKNARFKYVSPGIQEMLGYDMTAVLDLYDLTFVHPADRFDLYNILDKSFLRLNRTFSTKLRMIKRAGGICWIEIKGDVIVDASNELEYVVMNLRDITTEHEQAIAQQQYQKSLEQSIQKNNFKSHEYEEIADLMSSYDLKEPLRTISSYSQLVQHRYAKNLDSDGREFLQYTVDGANRMARMMDDILSFSNVSLEKFKPRQVSVDKAVKEVEHVLAQELKSSNAKIVCGELPEVKVDFIQFKQLLKNLFENALKFRGQNDPVIELDAQEMSNHFLFKVRDNGIGISKAYHESIFDVFGKIKEAGKANGTGVGLAVCKKIISNHDGKIWVESNGMGQGSVFCFTIPLNMNTEENKEVNLRKEGFQPALTFKKLKLNM
ncbi:MAG: ATP-binding protein [Saprospiraceae bacterium]